MFEVPNLDGMTQQELKELEKVFSTLSRYCFHKQIAMKKRLEGNIGQAKAAEDLCDKEYKTLPSDMRW